MFVRHSASHEVRRGRDAVVRLPSRSPARSSAPASAAPARAGRCSRSPCTRRGRRDPARQVAQLDKSPVELGRGLVEYAGQRLVSPRAGLAAARLSLMPVEMSSCWAPSWRSRSIRRRVSSPAARMRARESRTCSRLARSSAVSRRFSASSSNAWATESRTPDRPASSRSESTTAIGRPSASTRSTPRRRARRRVDRRGRGSRARRRVPPGDDGPRVADRPGDQVASRAGWCSPRAASRRSATWARLGRWAAYPTTYSDGQQHQSGSRTPSRPRGPRPADADQATSAASQTGREHGDDGRTEDVHAAGVASADEEGRRAQPIAARQR